ncbi:MAG: hypothetical protein RI967_2165, partial [Planctomycetota bacterium]
DPALPEAREGLADEPRRAALEAVFRCFDFFAMVLI